MTSGATPKIGDRVLRAARTSESRFRGVSYAGALWTLYLLTLRQHLHGKRWIAMALLFLLPAGIALLVRATSPHGVPLRSEFYLAMFLIPQAILPIASLLYASGIIQDEQEEQTLTYLLIRPLPKWALYLVKLAATWTTTVALTVAFTALTYAAIYVGAADAPADVVARCLKASAIHSLAVIAYCSLFGLMSLITRRTLVIGIVYTALVEGLLANLPFGIRLATVIYYTRLIAYHTLPFVVPGPEGGMQNLPDEKWSLGAADDPGLLQHPQVSTCLTVLLVASAVTAIVAAWLCTRKEFHVKTPEKA